MAAIDDTLPKVSLEELLPVSSFITTVSVKERELVLALAKLLATVSLVASAPKPWPGGTIEIAQALANGMASEKVVASTAVVVVVNADALSQEAKHLLESLLSLVLELSPMLQERRTTKPPS
jgi:hypothetical protein